MNLAVGKWNEMVAFEEVKDTLTQKIHDNADMTAIVEAVSQVNAAISVGRIIGFESSKDAKFDAGGVTVFLN